MIGALAILIGVGVCLSITLSSVPNSDTVDPCGPAASARSLAERRWATSLLFFSALACLALTALSHGHSQPLIPLAIVGMGVGVILHPWGFVRRVIVPVGAWRLALVSSRWGVGPWVRDPTGGPALAAALALMHRRSIPASAHERLAAQIDLGPLRGAGLVALALLAWRQDDAVRARRVLDHLDLLDPSECPPIARGVAVDWLITDAAMRGAWASVIEHGTSIRRPSPTARLLLAVAARRLGEPISSLQIWWLWLRAPARRTTRALVVRACSLPAFDPVDVDLDEVSANDGGGTERRAMALHREALVCALEGAVPPPMLRRLCTAWDICLEDFDFRRKVRTRALQLECDEALDRLVLRFHRRACRDIADMLSPRALPAVDSRTLISALELARRSATASLRDLVQELGRLRRAPVGTTAWDIWSVVVAMIEQYQRATVALPPEQARPIFGRIDAELTAIGAWLATQRGQRSLASALSLWLVAEADRVRDAEAADHHRRALVLV